MTELKEFLQQFINSFSLADPSFFFMWAIAGCAIISMAIGVERGYFIYVRSNVNAMKFMGEIRKLVVGGNIKKAIALCESAKTKALPYVVLSGLKRAAETQDNIDFRAIQNAVDEGTLETLPRLSERTGFLAMIGNVATLIGLSGTIYGLILSFAAVGKEGIPESEKSRLLANGISAAMNTTIAGLMVAIPSIILYTMIQSKTSQIIDEMDEHLVKLINLITGNR